MDSESSGNRIMATSAVLNWATNARGRKITMRDFSMYNILANSKSLGMIVLEVRTTKHYKQ